MKERSIFDLVDRKVSEPGQRALPVPKSSTESRTPSRRSSWQTVRLGCRVRESSRLEDLKGELLAGQAVARKLGSNEPRELGG